MRLSWLFCKSWFYFFSRDPVDSIVQRPGILIFYCTEQEEQTNILTTDGQYGRVGRPSRGENRRHCLYIHAQPRPMERLVNTRHWRGKTDTGPIEELPFFKVRNLNLHLQRFFCLSLVDKITFFLLRCPASPCLSLLLPCPAPQILSREKSAAPSIPAM